MANDNYLLATRRNLRDLLTAHSPEEQNTVPAGMNNNLIWNAGHVIATQELLTYGLTGAKTPSGRAFIDRYRKGTRPTGPVSEEEATLIAERLLSGADRLAADLEELRGRPFKPYTASFGVTLNDLDDALRFNVLHEALHLGTMLALRNLLRRSA